MSTTAHLIRTALPPNPGKGFDYSPPRTNIPLLQSCPVDSSLAEHRKRDSATLEPGSDRAHVAAVVAGFVSDLVEGALGVGLGGEACAGEVCAGGGDGEEGESKGGCFGEHCAGVR